MPPKSAKADCIYGASKHYKTSQLGWAAVYISEKYGKKTRIVTADGGGADDVLSDLIKAGVIEVWPIRTRPHLIEAIDKASQGWWPEHVDDPMSPILPYNDQRVKLKDFGMYCYEGLTSFGSSIMIQSLERPGVQLSQDPNFILRDGATDYAGGSQSAFGFVQRRMQEFVMKSHMIPALEKVIWTALEARGEERNTRAPVFGPAIEGRKAIGESPQWFGNLFHVESAQMEMGVDEATQSMRLQTQVYIYLKNHAERQSGVVYPAGIRVPFRLAHLVPEKLLLTDGLKDGEGKPVKSYNLKMVYEMIDDFKAKADKLVVGVATAEGVKA